jgi:hypothetical protein
MGLAGNAPRGETGRGYPEEKTVLLAPLAFATGLMAMAPQWAIVDLPYPEVTGAETASLRLKMADRTEIVVLLRVNNEWRVLQALVEGAEH